IATLAPSSDRRKGSRNREFTTTGVAIRLPNSENLCTDCATRRNFQRSLMIPWRRWLLGLGVALGGVLLRAAPGEPGILDVSWIAPTTNSDGSPMTDLASYRVYYGASNPPCPGPSFFQVAS